MLLKMNLGIRTSNRVESFFGRMKIFAEKKKTPDSFLNYLSIFFKSDKIKTFFNLKNISTAKKNIQKN